MSQDPEFPDLNRPHWQPTWGPNGEGFCIAIMTPGRILTKEEQAEFDLMNEELANAEQIIAPADDDEAKEGPPHRDPVGTAKTPQKLGNTATGWEAWIDEGLFPLLLLHFRIADQNLKLTSVLFRPSDLLL